MLKVYGLIIANVDILEISSNHEAMFPEYSRNIPRMSVSKICFEDVFNSQNFQNCFVDYPVKILIYAVYSLAMFF